MSNPPGTGQCEVSISSRELKYFTALSFVNKPIHRSRPQYLLCLVHDYTPKREHQADVSEGMNGLMWICIYWSTYSPSSVNIKSTVMIITGESLRLCGTIPCCVCHLHQLLLWVWKAPIELYKFWSPHLWLISSGLICVSQQLLNFTNLRYVKLS